MYNKKKLIFQQFQHDVENEKLDINGRKYKYNQPYSNNMCPIKLIEFIFMLVIYINF